MINVAKFSPGDIVRIHLPDVERWHGKIGVVTSTPPMCPFEVAVDWDGNETPFYNRELKLIKRGKQYGSP